MSNQVPNQVPETIASPTPRRSDRAAVYTAAGAAVLAAAGLVAALVLGLGGATQAGATAVPQQPAQHSAVRPASVPQPDVNPTPVHPTPAVAPSPTVRLLQQQLAQLNYYMGPINGIEGSSVHQAIQYLQRDAHLPQSGVLTPATQQALSRMLVQGNNQMAG